MTERSAAMAVLDVGNRAAEDIRMETETQVLRREVGEGFAGANVRIDELRRETTERIDELRRETTERIDELRRETSERIVESHRETTQRIDESRRETTGRIDLLRQETHAQIDNLRKQTVDHFVALEAKIELARQESSAAIADSRQAAHDDFLVCMAKIDDSRKEASDNFKALSTSMLDFHRETTARIGEVNARIDVVITESQRRMERSDAQFRWLVGLMISSLLATAGLFARAAHML